MERFLYKKLLSWKNSKDRKPLILEGARQVGKTWLLKEFGKNEYENLAYINCDNNPQMNILFSDFDTARLIRGFSAISGETILPGKTLLVLDEIQEIPIALTSLKYFSENAPEYHIAVAGSFLGILIHSGTGFPVGKTESMTLYPLSFFEFLLASGKKVLLDTIKEHRFEELNPLLPQLTELLRQYYFTGGMPEVVDLYIRTQDIHSVRQLQKSIIRDYERDFSKHVPENDVIRMLSVWNSIPSQLAKENKKFIYSAIRKGARAKDYEKAIEWLKNAGLIYKVTRIKKIEKPVKFYEDDECFKLFIIDLGLLGAMVDSPAEDVLIGNNVFSTYKGSFTEQYFAQQYFSTFGNKLYYHTNENSTLEIDFVVDLKKIYPVEVKAETNLRSKSLSTVLKQDETRQGIRFSMSPYKKQEQITNVPLPLAEEYLKAISLI